MIKLIAFLAGMTVASVSFGQAAAASDFARGNMHFSAKAMDTDNDGMISKDEFMQYHEAMWDKMTKDSNGQMALNDATSGFARGGMHVDAKAMDPDRSGMITKDKFMKYEATHWSLLPKDASGEISVRDMQKAMMKHRKKAAAEEAAAQQ